MSLGWLVVFVSSLAVLVLALNIKARRRGYKQFRNHHGRRKYRVPIDAPASPEEPRD